MTTRRLTPWGLAVALLMTASCGGSPERAEAPGAAPAAPADSVPKMEFDASWPKRPLPNNTILGAVMAIYVDDRDHAWVLHWPHYINPGDLAGESGTAECCTQLPAVVEFDADGAIVQSWGDPKDPNLPAGGFQWVRERGGAHGLYIDHKGNVWTGTHTPGARYTNAFANLAKFTKEGKFLLQKGTFGQSKGNADTDNFAQPTGIVVDPATNEAFIADGYDNRRIIVVDGDTMAFKRMWGAYGNKPIDDPLPPRAPGDTPAQQFRGVHCIKESRDNLLYVCDRPSDRIQVFRKDGTFVKEGFVTSKNTKGTGTVADVAFSPDPEQRFVYVADGLNRKVWILRRDTLETVGSFGNRGYYSGEFSGYLHALASDSKGNVYVGEHQGGNRVQRFKPTK